MPRVRFTTNLQRQVACPDADCPGGTVRAVLDACFARHPEVRGDHWTLVTAHLPPAHAVRRG